MITLEQYFNGKEYSVEQRDAAIELLEKVNAILQWAKFGGYMEPNDPDTKCQIGGDAIKGNGDGGFRLQHEAGAVKSNHKLAKAVDVYDPGNVLDNIISDIDLERFGLYREHPKHTNGWCHLQTVRPGSGNRSFFIS